MLVPKLDIIIVNWNAGNLLADCINSVECALDNTFILDRLVIVDNASSDNSLSLFENTKLPLIILKNKENLGFAKACNQGAKGSQADYLLFLNPDTQLFANSLGEPIGFLSNSKNEKIGIVGIQLIDEHNEISRNCSRFPTFPSMLAESLGLTHVLPQLFKSHFIKEWDHRDSRTVDQVMGSFFLIRRNLFEVVGGYDEKYFVYYEDLDLAKKIKKIGFDCYYLSSAKIYHKGGGTSEQVKATRLFYYLRSKIIYTKKHFSSLSYITLIFVFLFLEPFTRIINSIVNKSFVSFIETQKAYNKLFRYLIIHS